WLEKKGILDTASFLWWEAGYYKRAVSLWLKWMNILANNPQEKAIFLNKIIQYIYKDGIHNIPDKYKKSLLEPLSNQMILEKRYDLAIDLLRNCGEHQKADMLLNQLTKK
ncbi:MAG: hypothetical protein ACP5KS_08060, partial [Candidatus Hydrogenedens sp.]